MMCTDYLSQVKFQFQSCRSLSLWLLSLSLKTRGHCKLFSSLPLLPWRPHYVALNHRNNIFHTIKNAYSERQIISTHVYSCLCAHADKQTRQTSCVSLLLWVRLLTHGTAGIRRSDWLSQSKGGHMAGNLSGDWLTQFPYTYRRRLSCTVVAQFGKTLFGTYKHTPVIFCSRHLTIQGKFYILCPRAVM